MGEYRHIFFDLDHTLWDFHKNSEETLHQLFTTFNLKSLGAQSATTFIETYQQINHRLWDDYQKGHITKEYLRNNRFRLAFTETGVDGEHIADAFSEGYLSISPTKPHLLPNALETLAYLREKYTMSIITNGFSEVQYVKLKNARIHSFFEQVFISEEIGFQKPDPQIFNHALKNLNLKAHQTCMVGDNYETDIMGAINSGIDHIYFNPERKPHDLQVQHEITDLKELLKLL